jgi:hypothetical protein
VICCTKTRCLLRGSFFEILPKAGSYRGELLGLAALHTIVAAVAKFYKVDVSFGKICCDNVSSLGQSSKSRKRVSSGIKHSDLHRTIRTIKCTVKFCMVYSHVRAHQDRILPWSMLTLEQQLNVICNELANGAVARYLSEGVHHLGPKFLPFKKVAVVLDGVKLTTDVGSEVQYCLGKEDAERFYTKPRDVIRGTNRGGLGWSSDRFHSVAWQALDLALKSKPDMFQLWLSKQCIGICATRQNMARIQDILDDECPNCLQPRETSDHLNRCPDVGRTFLFRDSISAIFQWMHEYNHTDSELAYWLEKYLIYRGTLSMTALITKGGGGSPQLMTAAASQDLIGWTEFLHGKISVNIESIQHIHCTLSPCRITGSDWMKAMSSHLMQASHCQWIFRNFTLHDKQRGYLRLKHCKDLLRELDKLIDTPSDDIPEESRYLLELDYSKLYNASFERQSYWVLAMKAARRAGRRASASTRHRGRKKCCTPTNNMTRKARYDFIRDDAHLCANLGCNHFTIGVLNRTQMILIIHRINASGNQIDTSRELVSNPNMLKLHSQLFTGWAPTRQPSAAQGGHAIH